MRTLVLTLVLLGWGVGNTWAESSLERWLQEQRPVAAQRVHAAISPSGAARGSVFASPSRSEPDYYFHWVRDAALIMREIYEMRSEQRSLTDRLLKEFAEFSRRNQLTQNPSGGPSSGGLGEPKFNMDGSAFREPWGRPQNDGPALRAILLSKFAMDLWSEGERDYVLQKLYRPELPAYTVLKADLEYVAHHWREPSFDLWEESSGDHFYTRYVQWQALEWGSQFAILIGDAAAGNYYAEQAVRIRQSLDEFWSESAQAFVVTRRSNAGIQYKHSGIDVANLLAVIQVGRESGPFSLRDERILQTVLTLEERFRNLYAVNRIGQNPSGEELGTALGRYPEDRYDGYRTDRLGNPWFLATHAMAEFYYRLAVQVKKGSDALQKPRALKVMHELIRHRGQSALTQQQLSMGLFEKGDSFLRRSQFHTAAGGHQSEQFSRDSGTMQGAEDLTWSYASFLSALRAREELVRHPARSSQGTQTRR